MSETELTAAQATALDGTTDGETGFKYHAPGDANYYTEGQRQRQRLLTLAGAMGNRFRVYKDGVLTYGIRPGKLEYGDTTLSYAGSSGNALTDDATNYVWLYHSGGALAIGTSTSDFPNPSTTPHLPLATIVTASGGYAYTQITDFRQLGCFGLNSAATPAVLNVLVGGSSADALHTHAAAGLSSALREAIPRLAITATAESNEARTITLQVQDAAGNALAGRAMLRVWMSNVEYAQPDDPANGFTIDSGTVYQEEQAGLAYKLITTADGSASITVLLYGAGWRYLMAEFDGRIYSSGELTWAA
jgi:hypothetical protein